MTLEPGDRLSHPTGDIEIELLCPNGSLLKFSGAFEVVVETSEQPACVLDLLAGQGDVECGGPTVLDLDQVPLGCKGTRFNARKDGDVRSVAIFEGQVVARLDGRQAILEEQRAYPLSPAGVLEPSWISQREYRSTARRYARLNVAKMEARGIQVADRKVDLREFEKLELAFLQRPGEIASRAALADRLAGSKLDHERRLLLGPNSSRPPQPSSDDKSKQEQYSRHLPGEWSHLRGPYQNGAAGDTGLIDSWSLGGRNIVWQADFTSQSTPVVFDLRVCASGRESGSAPEVVACWDAETGKQLWRYEWDVALDSKPWAPMRQSPAADPETGHLYLLGVDGRLLALDRDGKVVWQWQLEEDLGRLPGGTGHTCSPIVDQDRVIVHTIGSLWGPHRATGDRYIAFDKATGEIEWLTNSVDGHPVHPGAHSTPVVAEIGDRRLVIGGGGDGWVRAIDARSGEPVWKSLSGRNSSVTSVVAVGHTIFASSVVGDLLDPQSGAIVAIETGLDDGRGGHERWRTDFVPAGSAALALDNGILYAVGASGALNALDADTGERLWRREYEIRGPGSPVLADGKIYLTGRGGQVLILESGEADLLSRVKLGAAIHGSAAIAYGRIYIASEGGIYCLGDRSKTPKAVQAASPASEAAPPGATPVLARVVPALALAKAGDQVNFRVRTFDESGRPIGETSAAAWSFEGVDGTIRDGVLRVGSAAGVRVGTVIARIGQLKAVAHLRIAGPLPWHEDFELSGDRALAAWIGVDKGVRVEEFDGGRVLALSEIPGRRLIRIGPPPAGDYDIQADVLGTQQYRQEEKLGLVHSGFSVGLVGSPPSLDVSSARGLGASTSFGWETYVWYTIKVRVDRQQGIDGDGQAIVKGKIWRRDQAEPDSWLFSHLFPISHEAPGLTGVVGYFDNVKVLPVPDRVANQGSGP